MNVLIVETKAALAAVWQSHLVRQGAAVACADCEKTAQRALDAGAFDVVVISTEEYRRLRALEEGGQADLFEGEEQER